MDLTTHDFFHCIIEQVHPDRSVLVGIDGGAGSGKTTFAHHLAAAITAAGRSVFIVHTDNFFRPSAERQLSPFAKVHDLDWERLRDQVLAPLRSGRTARFQLYDWPSDRLKDWLTIDVGGVTIVDGITAIRNELSHYYDLCVWFSCPRDIRVSRLHKRGDTGSSEIEHWTPSEEDYIDSHSPQETAHLVIDASADSTGASGNEWTVERWSNPRDP